MGDPRKKRKKYTGPSHPWEGERIQKENELVREYGLKNKKEVWKAKSAVGEYRQLARNLLGATGEEAEKEARELLNKLTRLGILNNYSLEGVLALTIDDILNRRLQTIVYRKGLANSVKQARQFVTHRHVAVGDNLVNVPGYIVPGDKEERIRTVGISQDMIKKPEEKAEELKERAGVKKAWKKPGEGRPGRERPGKDEIKKPQEVKERAGVKKAGVKPDKEKSGEGKTDKEKPEKDEIKKPEEVKERVDVKKAGVKPEKEKPEKEEIKKPEEVKERAGVKKAGERHEKEKPGKEEIKKPQEEKESAGVKKAGGTHEKEKPEKEEIKKPEETIKDEQKGK